MFDAMLPLMWAVVSSLTLVASAPSYYCNGANTVGSGSCPFCAANTSCAVSASAFVILDCTQESITTMLRRFVLCHWCQRSIYIYQQDSNHHTYTEASWMPVLLCLSYMPVLNQGSCCVKGSIVVVPCCMLKSRKPFCSNHLSAPAPARFNALLAHGAADPTVNLSIPSLPASNSIHLFFIEAAVIDQVQQNSTYTRSSPQV